MRFVNYRGGGCRAGKVIRRKPRKTEKKEATLERFNGSNTIGDFISLQAIRSCRYKNYRLVCASDFIVKYPVTLFSVYTVLLTQLCVYMCFCVIIIYVALWAYIIYYVYKLMYTSKNTRKIMYIPQFDSRRFPEYTRNMSLLNLSSFKKCSWTPVWNWREPETPDNGTGCWFTPASSTEDSTTNETAIWSEWSYRRFHHDQSGRVIWGPTRDVWIVSQ